MIRKLAYLSVVAIVIGIAAGLIDFGSLRGGSQRTDEKWFPPLKPEQADLNETAKRLIATGHFPGDRVGLETVDDSGDTENGAPKSMPKVISVSILDDNLTVGLQLETGVILSARIGDTVEGQWTIVGASLDKVILEKNGTEHQIILFQNTNSEI